LRRIPILLAAIAFCVAPFGGTGAGSSEGPISFRIEPTKTWVGVARVHLEVTDLQWTGGELVGRYSVRVPLIPSRNETGTIALEMHELQQLPGGTLAGTAHNDRGQIHGVDCTIQAGNLIEIRITTEKRVMTFETRFHPRHG
jgi:hypothetical protein